MNREPAPANNVTSIQRNHNLFKYQILINFMVDEETKPEGEEELEEKAEDLEEKQ